MRDVAEYPSMQKDGFNEYSIVPFWGESRNLSLVLSGQIPRSGQGCNRLAATLLSTSGKGSTAVVTTLPPLGTAKQRSRDPATQTYCAWLMTADDAQRT
jgi:hypothetical protein